MEKQKNENVTAQIPVRDTDGNFLFRKIWLNKYAVIEGPMSKVALTVTSTPNLFDPDDGSSPRYIVNLKAILRSSLPELKEKFGKEEYIRAEELNKLFLSGTIWVNEGQKAVVPMKGEEVLCNIGYVYSSAEKEEVLRITGISVQPAVEAQKLDVSAMFADDPEGEFANATADDFEKAAKV